MQFQFGDFVIGGSRPDFMPGLKRLAELGLELDTANPNPDLIDAITKVSAHP